jgi:hypothetical protein
MGSVISPIASLGGKAVGSALGGKSGSAGSPSTLSPQQASLAEFTMGQNMLKNNSAFANSGTGLSTMKSYADAGAQFGGAQQAAGLADQNAAEATAANSSLQSLASSAGFGSTGGNFGNTGGNFGDSSGGVNTSTGT